jgi:hypothetical protein
MKSVPRSEKTMIECICNSCSSYNECMRGEIMGVFCATGDAGKCVENIKECKCQECPVSTEYQFSSGKHCEMGSAEMQSH